VAKVLRAARAPQHQTPNVSFGSERPCGLSRHTGRGPTVNVNSARPTTPPLTSSPGCHAILTFFTCFLWSIVWLIIGNFGGERREMLQVDPHGGVISDGRTRSK
jgi:hypothetical protein